MTIRQRLITILVLTLWAASVNAEPYKAIDPAQPTEVQEGKVEVLEIFWYGCPHCYDFEPYLEEWLKNKPANVEFRRIPGIFRDSWIPHARAYYTAQELGVLDIIHRPMFDAIHKQKRNLNSQRALRKLFAEHAVDPDAFDKAYESDAVNDKVKKAFMAGRRYQIRGVPSLVINGKYQTSASFAGSYENMLKVTDELVDKETR